MPLTRRQRVHPSGQAVSGPKFTPAAKHPLSKPSIPNVKRKSGPHPTTTSHIVSTAKRTSVRAPKG